MYLSVDVGWIVSTVKVVSGSNGTRNRLTQVAQQNFAVGHRGTYGFGQFVRHSPEIQMLSIFCIFYNKQFTFQKPEGK